MKNLKNITFVLVQFLLLQTSFATEGGLKLPLVFDPQTKKYFIGGGTKLSLKPSQQGGYVDRIELAVDNDDYKPYDQSVEFKSEGKHTLKFRALNPVNTWSPVQFVEVFVDMSAPTTEVKYSDDWHYKDASGIYLGTQSTVTLAAQDNLSGVASIEYSFDGTNFLPYSKPLTFEKPGKQILFYRSIDRVGNAEVAKKFEFYADNTPPHTELKISGKSSVIKGQTFLGDGVSFELQAADEGSKVKQIWVVVDNKKPELYIKPVYFLEEGSHTFKYFAVDNVGNKEVEKSFGFYTTSSPGLTSALPVGKTVNMGGINYVNHDFRLKLEVKENVVGNDRLEYKLENQNDFKPYIEPLQFTAGAHIVSYRSIDRVGNVEPAKSYTMHVVEAPPETKLNTAQPLVVRDGVTYSPAPNVITLNVNSATGVGVAETWYSVNGSPMTPYKGPITVNSDVRDYKFTYKSIDRLGNEETVKTASFQLIRAVPVVDLFISNGKSAEEQVRTKFLDQPQVEADPRLPASTKPDKKTK